MTGRLGIKIDIFYETMRPDLDESLILDLLQGRIYENDRSIWEKHVTRHLDRTNPRSIIEVYALE